MVVAKNDESHRRLARQFSAREVHKTYVALVHGWPIQERGTIQSSISRDVQRRIRMTTRRPGGRTAVTHYLVKRRLDTVYGKFALLELKIETGRTHQIRVHLASLGHPVVGDVLYGAARELKSQSGKTRASGQAGTVALERNFLHSGALEFQHPKREEKLSFFRDLPDELQDFLRKLEG
jgi:23S rRNA pseudouridine1911/1915/1917 synthase